MRRLAPLLLLALVACAPPTPERAAAICEERARKAAGPTGGITVGVNSEDGPFTEVEIGISSDYLAGRDPMEVYVSCVYDLTGAAPIRPPRF